MPSDKVVEPVRLTGYRVPVVIAPIELVVEQRLISPRGCGIARSKRHVCKGDNGVIDRNHVVEVQDTNQPTAFVDDAHKVKRVSHMLVLGLRRRERDAIALFPAYEHDANERPILFPSCGETDTTLSSAFAGERTYFMSNV